MSDSTKKPENAKEKTKVEDAKTAEVKAAETEVKKVETKTEAKTEKVEKPTPATKPEKPPLTPEQIAEKAAKKKEFDEKFWTPLIRPVITLVCVCISVSLLLSITNKITKPIIKVNASAAADKARKELLPAAGDAGFEEMAIEGEAVNVSSVFKAVNEAGYVIEAYGVGYGGKVPVLVAFNAEANIAGVKFLTNNETPGLGKKLNTDPTFSAQFAGRANANILPSDIDSIASSTISTGAALKGINSAVIYFNKTVLGIEEEEMTPEKVHAMLLPNASTFTVVEVSGEKITQAFQGDDGGVIIYASGEGFEGDISAAVGFDVAGVITGVWLDTSIETDGFGRQVADNTTFTGQFAGKTNSEGLEVVAGASVTSKAVGEAIDAAVNYLPIIASGQAPPPPKPTEITSADINEMLLPDAGALSEVPMAVENVTEAYKAKDGSTVIYAQAKGYGGDIKAAVAMDPDGVIVGLWLNTKKETKGFGKGLQDDEEYIASFIGKTSSEGVDIVADATVSSNAIAAAVDTAVSAREFTTEEGLQKSIAKGLLPDAGELTKVEAEIEGVEYAFKGDDGNFVIATKAKGYESEITAVVAMDTKGTIIGIWLNTAKETKKFGRDIQENEEYKALFAGKSSADNVEGVAGATVSSKAIAEAVNAALSALPNVKGAA